MAGEWPIVTLQDACEIITDGAHASPNDCPGGLPMASVKDMARWGIDVKSSRTISHEDFEGLVRNGCQPQIGDVLIAKDGATCLDTVCEFKQPDKIVLLSSVAILRPSKRLHAGYLRYYLDCADTKAMLKAGYVSGSAIPRVILKDFRRAPIPLPSLSEQKAIAAVLGALDDKIELNRRMNATLEAMARALFQSWFVDFDPVRAKRDGRQPVILDLATSAFFPDAYQDSKLGHIPHGWEVGRLHDVLTLQRGFDLPKPDRTHGKYPAMAASGPNGCHDKFMVRGPGVTTGRSGVLGRVFFIHGDFWPLNTSLWVKEFKRVSPAYAFHLLRNLDFEMFNAGSAVPTLNRNHVHNLPVVIPPKQIVEAFDAQVMPLMRQQDANENQSRTLANFRDALLPKLLSGELTINGS